MSKPNKKKSKNPRFFCESCGEEVPRDEKKCPRCGRYFASVRCPSCDFIGEEILFSGGCPVCGYSSGSSRESVRLPESKEPSGALPIWVFILTAAVFTVVLAVLFFRFLR